MDGMRLLQSLKIKDFLSYGPQGESIELLPLNVLIGPNGSGKSNFIQAISLLKASPTDIVAPIREGGGIAHWIWKGKRERSGAVCEVEAVVAFPEGIMPLRHRIQLAQVGQGVQLVDEVIENQNPVGPAYDDAFFFYRYQRGNPVLNVREAVEEPAGGKGGRKERYLRREDIDPTVSVLSQRKDSDHYPELTYLGQAYSKIYLFRNAQIGYLSPLRGPQAVNLPSDFLSEDGSNLGLVLNDMLNRPTLKKVLLEHLRRFYGYAEDITTRFQTGTIETFLHERGFMDSTPSIRLSDGTLRFLCLLAILCHHSPPSLMCIEDPEIGLHPDIFPLVAELLVEASRKTQLIVTTHSEGLVSALSDRPEAVIVCERDRDGSSLRRLEPERLTQWLENYSLGELWRMGETGGNP